MNKLLIQSNHKFYETVLWIPAVFPFRSTKQRWGVCKEIARCENPNEIFWPQNGRCYEKLTRGPCTKGQLISASSNGLAGCSCNHKSDMMDYYYAGYGCFQHFTKGPCKEKGHLFLPDRSCDCSDELPHYHEVTKQCFEIGKIKFSLALIFYLLQLHVQSEWCCVLFSVSLVDTFKTLNWLLHYYWLQVC